MSNDFLVGQIVGVREPHKSIYTHKRFNGNTVHVLTPKDLSRGYYYTSVGSVDLSFCEVVSDYIQYYNSRTSLSEYDQSLLGAVTKPISLLKYFRIAATSATDVITTYIYIQDKLTKITGDVYDGSLYWMGLNSEQYRTKLKTTKDGYVVGRDVLIGRLSTKKKRLCFNLKRGK